MLKSLVLALGVALSTGCQGGPGGAPVGIYEVVEVSNGSPYAVGAVLRVGLREVAAPDFPSSYLTVGSCDTVQDCTGQLPWTYTLPEKDLDGNWLGRSLGLQADGMGSIRLVTTNEEEEVLLRAEYRKSLAGARDVVACANQDHAVGGRAFLGTFCLSCHSSDLMGDERSGAPFFVNFDDPGLVWQQQDRVHIRVSTGTMPPATSTEPQPTSDERRALVNWIECGVERPMESSR